MSADPQAVGEWMHARRRRCPRRPFSVIADEVPWDTLPRFDPNYSLGAETAAAYRRELEARADTEHQAAQMLLKLDGHEIGEDPGGQ